MNLMISLIVFVVIIISVNNFVIYYVIQHRGIHSKVSSVGIIVFLISLIEILAIGIWGYVHLVN